MKVLVTTEFYLPFRCGVTSAVEAERTALENTGDEVRILTIGSSRTGFYDAELRCWYVGRTLPSVYHDSYASVNTRDPVLSGVIEWKPDIIHSQSEFFSFHFASFISKKLSIPIVHTCHTDFVSYTCHFTPFEKPWNWAASKLVPLFIRRSRRIICSTDKIYDLISSYGVTQPVDRILVGVNLTEFSQRLSGDERRKMRQSLSFGDDDIVLVSVIRLSREKNVMETLSLFSALKKRLKRVKMLFVGDGEERGNLENRVKKEKLEDDVVFTGSVKHEDVWKYYRISDIYTGASLSETQCLSYIEAMASELALLVRDDKVLSSYLVQAVNGFSYRNEDEFLSIAASLAADSALRRRIGEEARRTSDAFSLDIFAHKLHDSFRKAMESEE